MATINDFGDTAEPLGQPALGGPTGWAAAIRDAIVAVQNALPGKSDTTHLHTGVYWKEWVGTQAQYDAIPTKDAHTLYVVEG